jgi:hypothetical protein
MNTNGHKMNWRVRIVITISLVVFFPYIPSAGGPNDNFNPNLYITPTLKYSIIGKGLALMYEPQLLSMAARINKDMRSPRFELIDVNRSPMGSIGFFASPSSATPTARYLGVTARVNIKLTYFSDTDAGRLSDAMDAFGKDLLGILGQTMGGMQGVNGVVLILVYSKLDLKDPNYWTDADAMAIFIPAGPLQEFNGLRLRFSQLYDQSEMFMFKGDDQINNLFKDFMKG